MVGGNARPIYASALRKENSLLPENRTRDFGGGVNTTQNRVSSLSGSRRAERGKKGSKEKETSTPGTKYTLGTISRSEGGDKGALSGNRIKQVRA